MNQYPLKKLKLSNANVEDGETISHNGDVYRIDGKSHAQGGEPVYLFPGDKIYSDSFKLPEDVVRQITGRKMGKKTPAELSRKYDTESYRTMISDSDEYKKASGELMYLKNRAMQETIFQAQEALKKRKGKNYEWGGQYGNPGNPTNKNPYGYSTPEGTFYDYNGQNVKIANPYESAYVDNNRVYLGTGETQQSMQFAGHPYIQQGLYKTPVETHKKNPVVTDYQSKLIGYNPNTNEYDKSEDAVSRRMQIASNIEQQNATAGKYLYPKIKYNYLDSAGNSTTKDKATDVNFKGFVDGYNAEYTQALAYQLEGTPNYPLNQALDRPTEPLPTTINPVKRDNQIINIPKSDSSTSQYDDKSYPGEEKKKVEAPSYVNPEDILNGLQQAYLLSNLVSIRKKNPLYSYTPSELAYTRYEPLNTLAQERAFNMTKESVLNSSMPEQVKQARIADMYGKMNDAVNQVQTQNYAGDLQNDNRNIQTYNIARNSDIQNREKANQLYLEQGSRADYLASAQRNEITTNMFEILRKQMEQREATNLLNQQFRNFQFKNGNVGYVPGRGVPPAFDPLAGYSTGSPENAREENFPADQLDERIQYLKYLKERNQ